MTTERIIKRATYAEGGETIIIAHEDGTHTVRDSDGTIVVWEWTGLSRAAAERSFQGALYDLSLSGVKPVSVEEGR